MSDSFFSNLTKKQKITGGIAAAVLTVCLLFTVYFVLSTLDMRGPGKLPDTPASNAAMDLSAKMMAANPSFADVQAQIESESPIKLRIEGEVHSQADLEALKNFVQEQIPNGDVTWAVQVVPKR